MALSKLLKRIIKTKTGAIIYNFESYRINWNLLVNISPRVLDIKMLIKIERVNMYGFVHQ